MIAGASTAAVNMAAFSPVVTGTIPVSKLLNIYFVYETADNESNTVDTIERISVNMCVYVCAYCLCFYVWM